jgi:hypothetical protein
VGHGLGSAVSFQQQKPLSQGTQGITG